MCDTCKLREIIILGQHKVATLIHIWVDCLGHLEKPVLAQGETPEYPCDYPRSATQAQRDHKILHA